MTKILARYACFLLFSFLLRADNPACHSQNGAGEYRATVSGTSAVTIVPAGTPQAGIIHLCYVEFATGNATSVTFQGSDGTTLRGPLQNVTSFSVWDDGQFTTRGTAVGSSLQIVLSVAPSSAIGVITRYYYTAQ
jgi:hypothetical protein